MTLNTALNAVEGNVVKTSDNCISAVSFGLIKVFSCFSSMLARFCKDWNVYTEPTNIKLRNESHRENLLKTVDNGFA